MPTFLQSIQQQDIAALQEFLQSGIDVNQPYSNDKLPLKIAIHCLFEDKVDTDKALQVIDHLLAMGADPNKVIFKDHSLAGHESLLHYLCRQGKHEDDIFNIDAKEDPVKNKICDQHRTLALALVKNLLAGKQKLDINVRNKNGETPFLVAVQQKNFEMARFLLSNNADATIASTNGNTALHSAANDASDIAFINILLDKKLDINAKTLQGTTPLDNLCNLTYGRAGKVSDPKKPEVILFFLQRSAQATHHDLLSFFRIAQEFDHQGLMEHLFTHGLPQYCNKQGQTALHKAKNNIIVERLLKNGATIHLQGPGFFRLFERWFSSYGGINDEKEIQPRLNLLREHKADFNITDEAGNTLLHHTADQNVTVSEFLIKNHVPVNAQNRIKQTALHKATAVFQIDSIKLLLAHGADSTLADEEKLTALEKISYNFIGHRNFAANDCMAVITPLLEKYPAKKLPSNATDLLLIAVYCNDLALLQSLHARGASLTTKPNGTSPNPGESIVQLNRINLFLWMLTTLDEHPQRISLLNHLMIAAVKHFRHEMIKQLIKAGVAINSVDERGEKLLGIFIQQYVYLSMPMWCYADEQQTLDALNKTFYLLLSSGIDVKQMTQYGTVIEQLLNRCGINSWPWIEALLEKGAVFPQNINYFINLTQQAAKQHENAILISLVNKCPAADKQYLLVHLARFAIKTADTVLLDQLKFFGLNFSEPLAQTVTQHNHQRYLLDEVMTLNTEQNDSNQQKLVVYFINQGVPLHYPTVNQYRQYCILHVAAKRGWVDVLTLLLQPKHGFRPNQRAVSYDRETPLQLTVQQGHVAAAQLLYQQGANPLVVSHEGKTLLHVACEKGGAPIVKWLLSIKKIDINARSIDGLTETAIHYAANLTDQKKGIALVELLISQGARVDSWLLVILIMKNAPENMLNSVLAKLSDQELLENRVLHSAVRSNNLFACQILLKRCSVLLNSLDRNNRTPLHYATAPGKQAIYKYLIDEKADSTIRDYEGYDVNTHALCHGTLGERANLIGLQEFKQLRTGLIEQKEFSAGGEDRLFSLSLYCHNFINLFSTAKSALSYIQKHLDPQSRQPLHDLCQFQFPTQGVWTKTVWADLFLQHGLKIAPYLHWAARIESILTKAPQSLAEIEIAAQQITYAREADHPQMAQLFIKHKVPEAAFNRALKIYPKDTKRQHHLPDIYIDGMDFKQEQYYLKKLPANDLRGFVLGSFTRCCQLVGGQGEACAMHGMQSPYGGFYVVFERSQDMSAYQPARQAQTLKEFLQKLSPKNKKQKYEKICNEIKTELQKDQKAPINEKDILNTLCARLKKKTPEDDEIVAQSWAWISQQGSLVLDSWERTRTEIDKLCLPFLERLTQLAITQHGFKRVLLGKGGQTPADIKLDILEQGESPKDYFDYRDSKVQYVLRSGELVNALATKVVTHSSLFKPIPMTARNKKLSLAEMDGLLQQTFMTQADIHLLPSVDLAVYDGKRADNDWQRLGKSIFILPCLTIEHIWTVLVIESTKAENNNVKYSLAYLDFSANRVPEQIAAYRRIRDTSEISTLQAVYNEDPIESGVWLLETMRHFAATMSLTIPVQNIIFKRAELIADTLKMAGIPFNTQPNPIGLVLDYSDLPRLKY